MSELTHAEMCDVIDNGGSISIKGQIITSKDHLPRPEKLAKTREEKMAIGEKLAKERADLDARLSQLSAELHEDDEDDDEDEDDDPVTPHPPKPPETPAAPTNPPKPPETQTNNVVKTTGGAKKAETVDSKAEAK